MTETTLLLLLVWLHFFGDFILQTDYMAFNKSKSNKILLLHVTVYSIPLTLLGFQFAVVNLVLHFMTDWCTSRATAKLWKLNKRYWFFAVIGLDQAIHMTCLILTSLYFWEFAS